MTITISQLEILKFSVLGLAALAIATFAVPTTTNAASLPYKPQTQLELISYMQGVVDTLQAQIAAGGTVAPGAGSSRVQTQAAAVAVSTKVELRASFDAGNSSSVYAWFEYGEGGVLDKKTARVRLTQVRGTATHEAMVSGLVSGVQYSYRPVFELSGGSKFYGSVGIFGTASIVAPGSTGSTPGAGSTVSSTNGTLTLSKTTYSTYNVVSVDFTIPARRANDNNWIGIYKVGAAKTNSIYWNYLGNQTSGKFTFKIKEAGTYEFRLYNDNNKNEVLTSRRFTVQ